MIDRMAGYLLLPAVLALAWAASRFVLARNEANSYPAADPWTTIDLTGWTDPEPVQTTSLFEDAIVLITPEAPVYVDQDTAARNVRAFLDMIAFAEGTAGPDGYRTMFGGQLFESYADHPRIRVPFRLTYSTAAGRYQFLARTWDTLKRRLNLPDFGPESQDAAAIELIRERGALADVQAGRVAVAVDKVRKIWASLPGAGYSQPERSLNQLTAAYSRAGGTLEQA